MYSVLYCIIAVETRLTGLILVVSIIHLLKQLVYVNENQLLFRNLVKNTW